MVTPAYIVTQKSLVGIDSPCEADSSSEYMFYTIRRYHIMLREGTKSYNSDATRFTAHDSIIHANRIPDRVTKPQSHHMRRCIASSIISKPHEHEADSMSAQPGTLVLVYHSFTNLFSYLLPLSQTSTQCLTASGSVPSSSRQIARISCPSVCSHYRSTCSRSPTDVPSALRAAR